jgi:CRP/FNR family cyclic AMP-dependent transcriptional regulator
VSRNARSDPIGVERLAALDLFAELDHYDLTQVARWAREVRAEPGQLLFEQGGMPYELFVIEQGEVEVVRDDDVLATLGPGDLVGEMSVLRGERRMASVRVVSPVVAVTVAAEDLAAMNEEMPEVVRSMRRITEERRRHNLAPRDDGP